MLDPHWRLLGACRGVNPKVFIPDDGDKDASARQHQEAITICNRCPVIGDCLEEALETKELYGVWGGKTPRQRRSIREQRQRELL